MGLRFHVYTQKRGCGSAALDSDDGIAAMNALTTEGEREQLLAIEVLPEQLPFSGDIACALYSLPAQCHPGIRALPC